MTRLLPILTLSRAGKVGMYISMYISMYVCMYVCICGYLYPYQLCRKPRATGSLAHIMFINITAKPSRLEVAKLAGKRQKQEPGSSARSN